MNRAPYLIGREGFERRGRWLVCVLTDCAIDAERFQQDVIAYLRAYYGAVEGEATSEQVEQASRDAERYYRDIFEMVAEHNDGQCACGWTLLRTASETAYLCPSCRIMVPADIAGIHGA